MPELKAVILKAKEDLKVEVVQPADLRTLPPGYVRIEVKSTGICGSDVHYLRHGSIGNYVLTQPMILGHESSGVVVAVSESCRERRIGDRVALEPGVPCRACTYCREGNYNLCLRMSFAATPPIDGTLQKYYTLPEDFAHAIPDRIDYDEAAMMEPLSVAVHIIDRLPAKFTSTLIVFGCGTIGLLVAAVARARGVQKILIIDMNASRLDFAARYISNVDTFRPPEMIAGESKIEYAKRNAEAILSGFEWLASIGGAHSVVDATGAEVCSQTAILCTRSNGYFVQAGMGPSEIMLPIGVICAKEITVLGSFRYRAGCYEQAINLVGSGLVSVKPLITHRFAFKDALQAFEKTAKAEEGTIKVIIDSQ